MSIEIEITKEYDGVKPKNFLKKKIKVPFFKIVSLIKDKRITINGKKIKKDTVMKEGDVLKVWPHDIELVEEIKNHVKMADLKIPVIFENDNFIVFNKRAGVVVQGAQDKDTSLSLHLAYYKNKIGDESDFEYFHVHRLDKDTSGCLVVAKNKVALRDLNEVFRKKDLVKKYLCLCVGELPKKNGEVEVIMRRNPQGSAQKMAIVDEKKQGDKHSLSYYRVLEEFDYEDDVFSLVEVQIKTGVTHQIRVHMKHLGCPIVGDSMYGVSYINRMFEGRLNRQFLHAYCLEFDYEGEKYSFRAPLFEDLEEIVGDVSELIE